MTNLDDRSWVTVQEFADAMKVSKVTIINKVRQGKIAKIDLPHTTFAPIKGKRHDWVIPKSELKRCMQEIDIDTLIKKILDSQFKA